LRSQNFEINLSEGGSGRVGAIKEKVMAKSKGVKKKTGKATRKEGALAISKKGGIRHWLRGSASRAAAVLPPLTDKEIRKLLPQLSRLESDRRDII
jgi:hypothetical protein